MVVYTNQAQEAGRFGSGAFAIARPTASTGTSRATAVRRTPDTDSPTQFCLMSPPPRGKVHMATDIAHYEDLND